MRLKSRIYINRGDVTIRTAILDYTVASYFFYNNCKVVDFGSFIHSHLEDITRTLLLSFSNIYHKKHLKWRVTSIQLPAETPQLPAVLIGQIETLIWRLLSVA